MSSARETETRARGATTNETAVGGDQKSRKFDVFIVSLETVLERLEIVDNVGVGSTETFDVFDEGVVHDVIVETVFFARVGSTETFDVFDEGIVRDVIVETIFTARVGSTKSLDVKVEKKGINLRLCEDTKLRVTFQTVACTFFFRKLKVSY